MSLSSSSVPVSPPPAALPTKAVAEKARVWKSALVTIFLACLLAPSLDLAFGVDHNPSPARDVVSFPRPRLDRSLLKWPGNLLWYLKSNMGFRGALVRAHGRFVWSVLGGSPAPESVLRADPWLFLKSERVPDDFRRVDPFSDADLGRWSEVLEGRRRWLTARGIRYLIVIAPNKETVYAGAVPPWVTRAPGPSRLAQLVARVRATTAVEIADLTAPLEAEKATARVYHLTDTHWNDLGAFVGYRSVIEHLEPWFKELRPLDRSDMVEEEEVTRGGDMARVCGLQLDLPEPQMRLALRPGVSEGARFADGSPLTFDRIDVRGRQRFVTRAPRGEIASAVILRDSFGEALIPYLSRHFQTATWIWTYDFPASEIETDRPALVIEQLVERKLMVLAPQNPAEVDNP